MEMRNRRGMYAGILSINFSPGLFMRINLGKEVFLRDCVTAMHPAMFRGRVPPILIVSGKDSVAATPA